MADDPVSYTDLDKKLEKFFDELIEEKLNELKSKSN
jgi:hypothetical protein